MRGHPATLSVVSKKFVVASVSAEMRILDYVSRMKPRETPLRMTTIS